MNNSDRVNPLQLPTNLTIVGVGGCGKRLTMEICKNDWFLDHYSSDGKRLKIYTMDTDANEKINDENQNEKLSEKIISHKGQGNIESRYYYLPSLANISQVSDLANKELVQNVKENPTEPKVNTWWLNDEESENGISFNKLKELDPFVMDDFGGGVHRRRAISKAIFYKVKTEGESSGFPTFSDMGSVAIVVGIGGGTGSGMFIDLARYIRFKKGDSAQLSLFVVLPTTNEGEKEQLNASIALTELEYLNLNERLFNNIIVTSLGPTGYKKGEEAKQEVYEFDAMFPNVFTNFYHIERGDINISDSKTPFSSFIFGNSHNIEYPIEDLKVLKDRYESLINSLELITNKRKELNQHILSYLDDYSISEDASPTKDNLEFIKKEYKNIENVMMHDIAKLLSYNSAETIEYFIHNNIPEDLKHENIKKFDDMISYLSRLMSGSMNVNEAELTDQIDKKLARVVPESIGTLNETAQLFKKVSSIESETTRSSLIELLKGSQNMLSIITSMNTDSKKISDQINELKGELNAKEQALEDIQKLQNESIKKSENKLQEKESDIDNYISLKQRVRALDDKEILIRSKLQHLIDTLESDEIKGRTKEGWLKAANVSEVQQEIKDLSNEFDGRYDNLIKLVENIALYYFYEYQKTNSAKGGIISFIKGDKKKKMKKFEALKKECEAYIKTNAKEWNIQINSPFEFYIPEDFLNKGISKQAYALKDDIISYISSDLDSSIVDKDEFNDILELDNRTEIYAGLKSHLRDAYLKDGGYSDRVESIRKETDAIKDDINKKQNLIDMITNVDKLHESTFGLRKDMSNYYNEFYDISAKVNESSKTKSGTQKSLYRTKVGNIDSKILSLVGDHSDLTNLENDDHGKRELDKLVSEIKATYPSLLENYKLGIHNQMIPISSTERWNFNKAGLVISSRSSYICSTVANSNIASDINSILSLSSSQDAHVITHRNAKNWEVSLTFLAATCFLDNISPLISGGGYWKIYEQNRDNLLHHVLMLQEGNYITRKKLLDVKKAGEVANIKDVQEISEIIEQLYEVKSLPEAFR
ncbi:tubulin-like doman-containing protein [Methanosalsum natronophilum]|uniref:tubulin-like doman-containing protein n=1 Tax=Methanosalsum natronophilum TaxID=768733 RepID=UPI002168A69B|nr:tubulin-like doman-containing protein [Methanosalsum natronophilum]MCS3923910.1 vacuolar-type H+-ATPase subunit I/STV1 [Methanosalsum natronophilum]